MNIPEYHLEQSRAFDNLTKRVRDKGLCLAIDDTSSAPRGAVIVPAEHATSEQVNRMLHISNGVIYVAITPEQAHRFRLQSMSGDRNKERFHPLVSSRVFTSVEARHGVTTGISASDRATTIRILGQSTPDPSSLIQPGHIFPVEARTGGVLVRSGIPECAIDIAILAGFPPAAAYAHILDKQGNFPNESALFALAAENHLPIVKLSELISWRVQNEEGLVECVATALLPTAVAGTLKACMYRSKIHMGDHIALVKGTIDSNTPVLTRVQTERTFEDIFPDILSGTGAQIQTALKLISESESGVLLYLRSALKGALREQIESRGRPDPTLMSPVSMMRQYGIGAQILKDLGVKRMNLISSKPLPLPGLCSYGLRVEKFTALKP